MVRPEVVLTLSDQDMNVLQVALIKLPYEVVAPLIAKIQMQLTPPKEDEQPAPYGASE